MLSITSIFVFPTKFQEYRDQDWFHQADCLLSYSRLKHFSSAATDHSSPRGRSRSSSPLITILAAFIESWRDESLWVECKIWWCHRHRLSASISLVLELLLMVAFDGWLRIRADYLTCFVQPSRFEPELRIIQSAMMCSKGSSGVEDVYKFWG